MAFRAGVYKWTYQGGNFTVAFRPRGVFYCEKFPAAASWSVTGNQLTVNWKNYGMYEFPLKADATQLDGYVQNNQSNWRKIEFLRDFNATERALLGDGFGTVWNFIYERGQFEIEFRVDGYNHFICKQFPAHSHWKLINDEILAINWGQYGEYVLTLNPTTNEFNGHKKDQPANWRRASFVRSLTEESLSSVPSHDHAHEHKHGEHCDGHHKDGKCGHDHGHGKKACCEDGDCDKEGCCDDEDCHADCDHKH